MAPVLYGFQAEGAAPLVPATRSTNPETVASAIRIGNPARWEEAMDAVTGVAGADRGGLRRADPRRLPRCSPRARASSASRPRPPSVAGILAHGLPAPEGGEPPTSVVCVLTGHGLKDPDTALGKAPGGDRLRRRPRRGRARDLRLTARAPACEHGRDGRQAPGDTVWSRFALRSRVIARAVTIAPMPRLLAWSCRSRCECAGGAAACGCESATACAPRSRWAAGRCRPGARCRAGGRDPVRGRRPRPGRGARSSAAGCRSPRRAAEAIARRAPPGHARGRGRPRPGRRRGGSRVRGFDPAEEIARRARHAARGLPLRPVPGVGAAGPRQVGPAAGPSGSPTRPRCAIARPRAAAQPSSSTTWSPQAPRSAPARGRFAPPARRGSLRSPSYPRVGSSLASDERRSACGSRSGAGTSRSPRSSATTSRSASPASASRSPTSRRWRSSCHEERNPSIPIARSPRPSCT